MTEFNFKTTVIERLSRLLMTGRYGDVEFILRDGDDKKRIKGHRLLFAASSPVFEAMLYGDLAERNEIEIDDIGPAAFKTMMRYIYTDDIELNSVGHATVVYQAADKYNLPQLEKVAEEYISSNINVDVACEVLEFSKLFCKCDIEKACVEVIKKQTAEVVESEGFVESSLKTVETIANQESLNASEFQLFNAIEKWAYHNAEKQGNPVESVIPELNGIISKIRFLSMTPDEFIKGPCQSKFLTFDERYSLMCNINVPGSTLLPERFSTVSVSRIKDKPLLLSLQNFYKDGKCVEVSARWEKREMSKLKFNQEYFSPEFYVGDKPFKIECEAWSPCKVEVDTGGNYYFRIYLRCLCNEKIHGPQWTCNTEYSFTLVSQKKDQLDYTLSSSNVFSYNCGLGWYQFIKWSELTDPERGLIKDDKLVIVATVKLKE